MTTDHISNKTVNMSALSASSIQWVIGCSLTAPLLPSLWWQQRLASSDQRIPYAAGSAGTDDPASKLAPAESCNTRQQDVMSFTEETQRYCGKGTLSQHYQIQNLTNTVSRKKMLLREEPTWYFIGHVNEYSTMHDF